VEISTSKTVAEREDEGVAVHLYDEKGDLMYEDKKPVTITVVGTYSKTYRRVQNEQRLKNLKGRRTQLTPEGIDQKANEAIARCVTAWSGFTSEGKPFPYTEENAVALFQAAPWIREQVEEAMGDHAAFFPKSSTN
jgi:hypothetical protein